MNKELIEKLLLMLVSDTTPTSTTSSTTSYYADMVGKYVIIRGYYSGVHFGKLEHTEKNNWKLSEARRLRYRENKKGIGLNSLVVNGIKNTSKLTAPINITIVEDNICELYPIEDKKIIKEFVDLDDYIPQ